MRTGCMLFGMTAMVLFIVIIVMEHRSASPERGVQQVRQNPAVKNAMSAAVATSTPATSAVATVGAPSPSTPSFQERIADGKDTNSIRKWAHNELEVKRMLDENDRIYRRQLVGLKETVAALVERNRLTGEQIRQLTLPGLDGQEIAFEVKGADIAPSGLRGTFYGRVAGRPDSMVTLAFLQRRQAYTILSPADKLYLDVEPHDPGDVIVKSINLEKYGAGLCGKP
jgi:hypothetical protein